MTPPTGVADANSVIGLAKGGVFHLLRQLFASLFVPPSVAAEVIVKGQGRPGASELGQALGTWVSQVTPDAATVQQFAPGLSAADREVLAVAQAQASDYILTDDRGIRREASRHQLACLGVAEVVVLFKEQGLLPDVRSVLDRMRQAQHGIDPTVYERVLRRAGEWPTP